MFAGEKTIFAMHKRTPTKSGGRQPAVVVATHWQGTAKSRETVVAHERQQSRISDHGGRQPAALVLQCECLPAKKRFLRCTNAGPQKAAGVSPPWV
jgi:hypothetical protein